MLKERSYYAFHSACLCEKWHLKGKAIPFFAHTDFCGMTQGCILTPELFPLFCHIIRLGKRKVIDWYKSDCCFFCCASSRLFAYGYEGLIFRHIFILLFD